ncbi:MAG: hypothetical protein JNJ77_11950 [Planctomycetia bacterium]|nr:hypothetical protein [Planctomycetia bacterium]
MSAPFVEHDSFACSTFIPMLVSRLMEQHHSSQANYEKGKEYYPWPFVAASHISFLTWQFLGSGCSLINLA